MSFSSNELNYLIFRYLKESGFEHSAFTFANESRVNKSEANPTEVLPGTLIYVVQKGLHYMEVEASIQEDGSEIEIGESIKLLTPYTHLRKKSKTYTEVSANFSENGTNGIGTANHSNNGGTTDENTNNKADSGKRRRRKRKREEQSTTEKETNTSHDDQTEEPYTKERRKEKNNRENTDRDGDTNMASSESDKSDINSQPNRAQQQQTEPTQQQPQQDSQTQAQQSPQQSPQPSTNSIISTTTTCTTTTTTNSTTSTSTVTLPTTQTTTTNTTSTTTTSPLAASNSNSSAASTTASPTTTSTTSTTTTPLILSQKGGGLILSSAVTILEGHTSEVFSCSWNPKQLFLASGSGDSTARIWKITPDLSSSGKKNAEEIQKNCIVLRHGNAQQESKDVTTLDWNSDGTLLATGSYDGMARIYDCKGKLKLKLDKHTAPIFSLKWSSNGEHLLSGSVDKSAIVWDISTGLVKQQNEFHTASVLDVDWKDNQSFATCSGDTTVCCFVIGKQAPEKIFKGHKDEVNSIRWSPDGNILGSCSDDYSAKLWKWNSTGPVHDLREHQKEVYTLRWSPTGPGSANPNAPLYLATASFDTSIKLWDPEVGKSVFTLSKHLEPVYSVSFSPTGQYLATGSFDKNIHIWSVKDGKCIKTWKGTGGIFEVSWNSRGDRLAASTSDNSVAVIDLRA